MIGKTMLYTAIAISLGFAVERKVIDTSSGESREFDSEFDSATEVSYLMAGKRSVFGQDDQGQFFSQYEKDPHNPDRTLIKFVRAKKDRQDKSLLEYVECNSRTMLEELKKKDLFFLTSDEIRKRLVQDGPTY